MESFGSKEITFVALTVVATYVVYWIVKRKRAFKYFASIGVASPANPSFVSGHTKEFLQPETFPARYVKQYGRFYGMYIFGANPVFCVADHDLIKETLIKNFDNFRDRPMFLRGDRSARGASNLIALTGNDWKRVRNTLTPTFSTKKLKQVVPIMNKAIEMLIDVLRSKAKQGSLEIRESFQGLTLQVIGECVFAMKVDSLRNQNDQFLNSVRQIFSSRGGFVQTLVALFPLMRKTPGFQTLLGLTKLGKANTWLLDNIEFMVKYRQKNRTSEKTVDYLSLMLDAADASINSDEAKKDFSEEKQDENATESVGMITDSPTTKYLNSAELVSNSLVFLLAGYETTSTLLAHAAFCLARNPDVQNKLVEEINSKLGDQGTDKKNIYDVISKMKYLENVVKEVLRLYPPVSQTARQCTETCTLSNGVTINKGTSLFYPIWFLNHDPEVYEDPNEFRPERWEDENIPSFAWVPFGAGPRNCIGMRFAQIESKLALVQLVKNFIINPCEKTDEGALKCKSRLGLVYAENGVWINLKERV